MNLDQRIAEVRELIAKRMEYAELEKSGGDHPCTNQVWQDLLEIIAVTTDDAIAIIDACSELELPWLSEVFDDLSEKLQSTKFIDYLEQLQERNPGIDFFADIKYAKVVLNKEADPGGSA